MADIKISALPTATTPLTGAELVPIVQSGVTKQTTTSDVLAVPVTSLTASSAVATDASKKLVSVTNTGTGNNVLATSPTLVTPILGTPQSATLTNATGLPLTTGVTGLLPVANGGTGTATPALVAGSNVSITGSWPNQTINSSAPGTGTVTSVSVVSANGLAGTVANATTTPAITLSTSVTGIVKGNGTTLSAATAGTDYVAPGGALGTPSSGTVTNLTGTANITATGGASGAIAATTLSASSTVSGTGFTTYLASPPAIGGTAAAAGSFTTLAASSTVSGTGFSTYLASPPAIGGTAPAAVSSTALSYTTTLTGGTGIVNLGSGQFYKDASGNVGIGKTPVAGRGLLQVNGDTEVTSLNTGQLAGLRNKIINGGFDIWQRGTSGFAVNTYGADRFFNPGNVTTTSSQGAFTAGNPITGYEPTYYLQSIVNANSAAGDYSILEQRIEDVRTFAGQTCTLSFWGRTTSGTLKTSVEIAQIFGTGGSGSVFTTAGAAITLTTTWTRFSVTISVPSISGKTIGTSSFFGFSLWLSAGSTYAARSNSIGNQAGTFQVWGWQAEIGSVATPFEQRPYGMELALCQRYYQSWGNNASVSTYIVGGSYYNSTNWIGALTYPVQMRTAPTLTYSALADFITEGNSATTTLSALTINSASITSSRFTATVSTSTQGYGATLNINVGAGKFFALSAEL